MSRSDLAPDATARSSSQIEDRTLRVVLEVDRGGPCFIDDLEGDVLVVDVRVDGDTCRTEVTVCETVDGEQRVVTKHKNGRTCAHCPGAVFARYGCIPHVVHQNGDSQYIKTFVTDTATVADLVEELRAVSSRVRLVSITDTGPDESLAHEVIEVDLSSLTAKQREALELAVEAGYYGPGSDPSLETLADRIGISASALSQRLSRAEMNVMNHLVDH